VRKVEISAPPIITADTALRLAYFFGSDAQNWMNLQAGYDLETAQLALAERIKR
jgi:antitoxin HigA-1